MANRYWNPSWNANWWDANVWATTDWWDPTWVATPTSSDDVFFTSTNSYRCRVAADANCKNLDFTWWTWFIWELSWTKQVTVYWNLTISSWMTLGLQPFRMKATSWTNTITTAWKTIQNLTIDWNWWTFQLLDNLNIWQYISFLFWTFDPNWKTVIFSYSGWVAQVRWWWNFYNLTCTWDDNKTRTFQFYWDTTISNNLTINWNSSVNRILVKSDIKWTQRTITAATVTVTNADFQDIKWAWSWSWDLSWITWWSWDCWGNTDITFTTPTTTTCSAWTTWSTATWDVRVPLPQDTANFSWSSRTITQDMPCIWSVDFTWSSWLTWTTSTACSVFGSINLTDLGTLTASTQTYTFEWRWSNTITSAWKTWEKVLSIQCISWTITLWDDLILWTTITLQLVTWTFTTNNNNITAWAISTTSSTINLWNSTLEFNWDIASSFSTLSTLNEWNSTIKLTWILTANRTFWWGNFTFYNFWNATTWDYIVTISWSNTFNDFKIDADRKVNFTTWTTTTVNTFTTPNTWDPITIRSSTTTNATLTKAWWWVISCDYIDIDYITGSPDDAWYMWTHSIDWWHNSQIYFTEPPVTTNITNFFMFF
jgi:hypothetical protein